jgi:hypothetical protein
LLLTSHASPTRADEPDAVFVEEGGRAPFDAICFPPARAERLGAKAETCELRRQLDGQLATDRAALQLDACNAKLKLADEAGKAREALLVKALEDAREAGRREVWEEPAAVLAVGVVAGIAATVGAVLLVGQLRPLVPAP